MLNTTIVLEFFPCSTALTIKSFTHRNHHHHSPLSSLSTTIITTIIIIIIIITGYINMRGSTSTALQSSDESTDFKEFPFSIVTFTGILHHFVIIIITIFVIISIVFVIIIILIISIFHSHHLHHHYRHYNHY